MKKGWTPDRPTVFIEGERDRIEMQSSKIKLYLLIPKLSNGIITWLRDFGDLYYGRMIPEIYNHKSHSLRELTIKNLSNALILNHIGSWEELAETDFERFYRIKSSAFYMHMARKGLSENWRWPAFCTYKDNDFFWENGNSRCCANAVTKKEPWKHQYFLYWQAKNVTKNPLIPEERVLVEDDKHLHHLLNLDYEFKFQQPILCDIGITQHDNEIVFKWIHDGEENRQNMVEDDVKQIWYNYIAWKQLQPEKPRIRVFASNPDLVIDPHEIWQVEGHTLDNHSDSLNHLCYREHNNKTSAIEHTLWYRGTEKFDLGDLLFWIDTDYSVYNGKSQNFVFYRADAEFVSRDISVSVPMQTS